MMKKSERRLRSKKEILDHFLMQQPRFSASDDRETLFRSAAYEFWRLQSLLPERFFADTPGRGQNLNHAGSPLISASGFDLMILYDISRSVSFGRKELLQANIAVSLAYTAILGGNACGLILFADDVSQYIPPQSGWRHFQRIVSAMMNAEPPRCRETHLHHAVSRLIRELPRSLTFILSDFLYPFQWDAQFQQGFYGNGEHKVRALQILEEFETALPRHAKGLISFYDCESGDSMILDLGKWRMYNRQMKQRSDYIRYRLLKVGIDSLILTPADDFQMKINQFIRV